MGYLSDYSENKLLDHVLKTASYTPPTHIYLGLSLTNPQDDGSEITEPSGGDYARILVDDWDTAIERATRNTSIVEFAEATAGWGTTKYVIAFDANEAGNMLAYGALSTPRLVNTGDIFSFAAGMVEFFFLAGGLSNYLANKLLDHLFKVVAYTPPTNIYVAVATSQITDSTTGSTIVEPDDATYERVNHNSFNAASDGIATNDGDIAFPQATEDWDTLVASALIDADEAGNILFYGELDSEQVVALGSIAKFADTTLVVSLD